MGNSLSLWFVISARISLNVSYLKNLPFLSGFVISMALSSLLTLTFTIFIYTLMNSIDNNMQFTFEINNNNSISILIISSPMFTLNNLLNPSCLFLPPPPRKIWPLFIDMLMMHWTFVQMWRSLTLNFIT